MRILWVSARIFDENEETQSGVWLKALAMRLTEIKDIVLGNVSWKPGESELTRCDFGKVQQWGLPPEKVNKRGMPSTLTQERFEKIVSEFEPDIIQVWGSENPLKILPFEKRITGIKVLTIQGVLGSIGPVMLSGLNLKEIISTIGIRELLKRRNLLTEKKSFHAAGKLEDQMIKKSEYIITQSEWTDSQIKQINPNARLFRTTRALRSDFLNCKKWPEFDHPKPIIYSAAVGYSLKGLHVLIRSIAVVKKQYPDVELRLVGKTGRKDYLGDGYLKLILRMIRNHGLENNVTWLGALTAKEIISQLQEASVFVNPSFIESYSLTLAEAMSVGIPSVVSFAGAMPELAENNRDALFFSPGDFKYCAHLIIKLLSNQELALKISKNVIKRSEERELKTDVVNNQIKIYKEIIRLSQTK